MSSVRLRVDKNLGGTTLEQGAMVEVRRIDEAGRRVGAPSRAIASMGPISGPAVTLAPGRYEFSAMLPSGDVLTRVADVRDAAASVEIVFEPDRSAHEWMGWQHALGNVAGADAIAGARVEPPKSRARRGAPRAPAAPPYRAHWFRTSAQSGTGETDAFSASVDEHLRTMTDANASAPFRPRATTPAEPLHALVESPFYSFPLPQKGPFDYRSKDHPRSYLVVSDESGRETLGALPHPWVSSSGGGLVEVEALVGPDQPIGVPTSATAPWCVSIVARDPQVASVLSYSTSGDSRAATLLASSAIGLLLDKFVNPMAAAAGAYVLVDHWLEHRERGGPWIGWVDNLAQSFPWLPDGEILRAQIALARNDLATTRRSLVEADRRGIPLYTDGVRRLESALTRLSNQDRKDGRDDPRLAAALQRARRLAWAVDARYPFTTLRLWLDGV